MAGSLEQRLAAIRDVWDGRAARYLAGPNRRFTLQAATHLHSHLQLHDATRVLEVAAGPGLGSLDIARRLAENAGTAGKTLIMTDFAPAMVELARGNLEAGGVAKMTEGGGLEVTCTEANALDVAMVVTGSVDRYIATLGLQLVPDADAMLREARRVLSPDGLAGFVIWGRPEHSGAFTVFDAAEAELGLGDGAEDSNFALGKDVEVLRGRFERAGFSQLRVWPFLSIIESWSGAGLAEFLDVMRPIKDDEEMRIKRFEAVARLADEWLEAKGVPLGLEMYMLLAKP